MFSHDHAAIYFLAGTDEEGAALLGIKESIGDGLACLKSDEGALFAVWDIAFEGTIAVKLCVNNTISLSVCHKFPAVADEAAGGNNEFKPCSACI